MILELGLLAGTYLGAKLYGAHKARLEELEEGAGAPAREAPPPTKAEIEKQQALNLKAAVGSMVLFAAKPLIPGAVPLGLAAYLYAALPYMRDVEKSLFRDKKINVDVLFFVADALTLGVRNYFTAALGLTLIHHGKLMVKKARDDSAKLVTHLFKELPQTVWRLVDGVEVEVPLADVREGDELVLTSGVVIPVDGIIEEGVAQVDQRALTGEAQPAEKAEGDAVFANTIVSSGRIRVRVTRSGNETTSAQIAEMLLNSVSFKSGIQLKGERWADKMSAPMLVSALAMLPITGPVPAVVFINSHIGARILLFAPLATLRHISEASRLGVLVKDGRALEQLGEVDTILFDKTGTLTTDQPVVASVRTTGTCSARDILTYAATAQRRLHHPIARAILQKAAEEGVTPIEVQDSSYTIGYGVEIRLEDRRVRVGSLRFFQQQDIPIPEEILAAQARAHGLGNTFILVGMDERVEGTLELEPQIRPEARAIVQQLRQLGIKHMAIVSGDDRAPTQKLAEHLGMDEYFHNALPERKSEIVEALQAEGRVVCFIGDGINDSIALKKANISISIAGATSIARDQAEIIMMDGTLQHLVELVEVSRRLEVNLRRSLVVCLIPSAVNLVGAFVLKFHILTAMMINVGFSALGVTRAFYTRKRWTPQLTAPPAPAPAPQVIDLAPREDPVEPRAAGAALGELTAGYFSSWDQGVPG